MTRIHSRQRTLKPLMSLGLVLFVVVLSGCEVLATEGARDAIAGQREVRALESQELGPLEQEMNALVVGEIQPRETQLDDLRYELQTLEEDLLQPLWDAQNDPWGPGGEASAAQTALEGRYRELDLMQRSIDSDQRDLESKWQNLWAAGAAANPEFKALEDLRYEKQRELDRVYRFGNRPIEDIWNEINKLNSNQNWGNTDSQIQSEEINNELRRLYDLYAEVQSSGDSESAQIEEKARAAQHELDNLRNNGWDQISGINAEIERLEAERADSDRAVGEADSIRARIAELEGLKEDYVVNRDAEVASLKAALAAIVDETATAGTTGTLADDNGARIAELELLIAGLEAESAALVADRRSEIDSLTDEIEAKKASYDLLIDSARADFQVLSTSLLADADALGVQIDQLTEAGGEGSADEISDLQQQKDALVAQEVAEEASLHDSIAQFESDRDAGVSDLESSIDALEETIGDGLTDDIDSQIAEHRAEIDELRDSSTDTTVLVSNVETSSEVLANIESSENYWNGLIHEADVEIEALRTQLASVAVDDSTGPRIKNLQLQAAELERALNDKIANLEAVAKELFRQASDGGSRDSGRLDVLQSKIDKLNDRLEAVWQQDSSNGLGILRNVQKLEKQARSLEDELKQKTRKLEEDLWDLDDQLNGFYRDQESGGQELQAEYEAENAQIQQRRAEIEDQRWAIDEEERKLRGEIEAENIAAAEEIKQIEDGKVTVLRTQIRKLELELRDFYGKQRELENRMGEARRLVEEKKRELEDNVLNLLETAAGSGVATSPDTGPVDGATEGDGDGDNATLPVPDTTGEVDPETGDTTGPAAGAAN